MYSIYSQCMQDQEDICKMLVLDKKHKRKCKQKYKYRKYIVNHFKRIRIIFISHKIKIDTRNSIHGLESIIT